MLPYLLTSRKVNVTHHRLARGLLDFCRRMRLRRSRGQRQLVPPASLKVPTHYSSLRKFHKLLDPPGKDPLSHTDKLQPSVPTRLCAPTSPVKVSPPKSHHHPSTHGVEVEILLSQGSSSQLFPKLLDPPEEKPAISPASLTVPQSPSQSTHGSLLEQFPKLPDPPPDISEAPPSQLELFISTQQEQVLANQMLQTRRHPILPQSSSNKPINYLPEESPAYLQSKHRLRLGQDPPMHQPSLEELHLLEHPKQLFAATRSQSSMNTPRLIGLQDEQIQTRHLLLLQQQSPPLLLDSAEHQQTSIDNAVNLSPNHATTKLCLPYHELPSLEVPSSYQSGEFACPESRPRMLLLQNFSPLGPGQQFQQQSTPIYLQPGLPPQRNPHLHQEGESTSSPPLINEHHHMLQHSTSELVLYQATQQQQQQQAIMQEVGISPNHATILVHQQALSLEQSQYSTQNEKSLHTATMMLLQNCPPVDPGQQLQQSMQQQQILLVNQPIEKQCKQSALRLRNPYLQKEEGSVNPPQTLLLQQHTDLPLEPAVQQPDPRLHACNQHNMLQQQSSPLLPEVNDDSTDVIILSQATQERPEVTTEAVNLSPIHSSTKVYHQSPSLDSQFMSIKKGDPSACAPPILRLQNCSPSAPGKQADQPNTLAPAEHLVSDLHPKNQHHVLLQQVPLLPPKTAEHLTGELVFTEAVNLLFDDAPSYMQVDQPSDEISTIQQQPSYPSPTLHQQLIHLPLAPMQQPTSELLPYNQQNMLQHQSPLLLPESAEYRTVDPVLYPITRQQQQQHEIIMQEVGPSPNLTTHHLVQHQSPSLELLLRQKFSFFEQEQQLQQPAQHPENMQVDHYIQQNMLQHQPPLLLPEATENGTGEPVLYPITQQQQQQQEIMQEVSLSPNLTTHLVQHQSPSLELMLQQKFSPFDEEQQLQQLAQCPEVMQVDHEQSTIHSMQQPDAMHFYQSSEQSTVCHRPTRQPPTLHQQHIHLPLGPEHQQAPELHANIQHSILQLRYSSLPSVADEHSIIREHVMLQVTHQQTIVKEVFVSPKYAKTQINHRPPSMEPLCSCSSHKEQHACLPTIMSPQNSAQHQGIMQVFQPNEHLNMQIHSDLLGLDQHFHQSMQEERITHHVSQKKETSPILSPVQQGIDVLPLQPVSDVQSINKLRSLSEEEQGPAGHKILAPIHSTRQSSAGIHLPLLVAPLAQDEENIDGSVMSLFSGASSMSTQSSSFIDELDAKIESATDTLVALKRDADAATAKLDMTTAWSIEIASTIRAKQLFEEAGELSLDYSEQDGACIIAVAGEDGQKINHRALTLKRKASDINLDGDADSDPGQSIRSSLREYDILMSRKGHSAPENKKLGKPKFSRITDEHIVRKLMYDQV